MNHALLVTNRIIQLGDDPVTDPRDWFKLTKCTYKPLDDPFVKMLLIQNIAEEQCAIGVYKQLMWMMHETAIDIFVIE